MSLREAQEAYERMLKDPRYDSHKQESRRFHEAIILAAEQIGEDGLGKDGLVGYLSRIACTLPRSFASLLRRALCDEIPLGSKEARIKLDPASLAEAVEEYARTREETCPV